MIGLGSNRLTVCRRGGMRVTQAGRGGMEWLAGGRMPSWASPYSAQATAALKAQFPTQWPTIRDYGFAHPEIVPIVNQYPFYAALKALYHCVEYIQTSGTQYLETTYLLDNTDIIETDILLTINNACVTWGTRNFNEFWVGSSGAHNWGTMSGSTLYRSNLSTTEFRNVKHGQNGIYVNDSLKSSYSGTQSTTKDTYGLWIFKVNSAQGEMSGYNSCGIRMKGFKVKKSDNSLGLWLEPCYDDGNVIGMYDVITNTFYTNKGTGTFGKGADVN